MSKGLDFRLVLVWAEWVEITGEGAELRATLEHCLVLFNPKKRSPVCALRALSVL